MPRRARSLLWAGFVLHLITTALDILDDYFTLPALGLADALQPGRVASALPFPGRSSQGG